MAVNVGSLITNKNQRSNRQNLCEPQQAGARITQSEEDYEEKDLFKHVSSPPFKLLYGILTFNQDCIKAFSDLKSQLIPLLYPPNIIDTLKFKILRQQVTFK